MMFASFSDLLARVGALELTLLLLIGFCIGAGFVCALVFGAGFFWPKPAPSVYVPPGPGLDIDAIYSSRRLRFVPPVPKATRPPRTDDGAGNVNAGV